MATWELVRAKRELVSSRKEASPKSVTLGMPPACSSNRMFSGLRSRWMTPRWCAYSMARQISNIVRSVSSGSWWGARIRSRRDGPSTNSITR